LENLLDLAGALQLAAAGISLGAALYLARFKYTFIEELKKLFILKPEDREDMPVTRRENRMQEDWAKQEHSRLEQEIAEAWVDIGEIWDEIRKSGGRHKP
jgi:hypothetical protein